MIVKPLPYILHAIVILKLVSFYPIKHRLISLWNRLVLVVRQTETMIEAEVKFFEALPDSLRMGRGDGDYFWFWGELHLVFFLFCDVDDWRLPPDDAVNSFLIDRLVGVWSFVGLRFGWRMAEPSSIDLRDDYFFILDVLKVVGTVVAHFE